MTEIPIDLTELDDDTLDQLVVAAHAETHRRAILASAEARADKAAAEYLEARDGSVTILDEGAAAPSGLRAYRQPTGAHDAYPKGATIVHAGRVRRSIIPANVWPPDVYPQGWEDLGPADGHPAPEPEPDAPAYQVGVDYSIGDRFTFEGAIYRVIQAHTSAAHWPPNAAHSLYSRE